MKSSTTIKMIVRPFIFCFCLLVTTTFSKPSSINEQKRNDKYMHPYVVKQKTIQTRSLNEEVTAEFWRDGARNALKQKLEMTHNNNIAKNVIMFLGDGMSIPTLTAARIYLGQLNNDSGEEQYLSFERFPYTALSKTYCVDRQVADSACTATAYLCGVKNNRATIGVTAAVEHGNCAASLEPTNRVTSIARWAQLAEKRTGVVTTTRVTHASPAGIYAHVANRDWEDDTELGSENDECDDIALQAIHGVTGTNLNVLLGGGRARFLPKGVVDEEGEAGRRSDGRNLIEEWLSGKQGKKAEYVWNRAGLLGLDEGVDYLLGLFEGDHMQYHLEADVASEPTLAELTEVALRVLNKSENGYFLFVEGGRIDHAHHDTKAKKAFDETVEFSKAIQRALELTQREDTLIVVTSDHAHTMSISGYPDRGTDIFETIGNGDDGLPYSTISYANGPGYAVEENGKRRNMSADNTHDNNYMFATTLPLESETHGGDDVGIFAIGPHAHLFTGVVEQNLIPHIMAYSACLGDYANNDRCYRAEAEQSSAIKINEAEVLILSLFGVLLTLL